MSKERQTSKQLNSILLLGQSVISHSIPLGEFLYLSRKLVYKFSMGFESGLQCGLFVYGGAFYFAFW